MMALVTDLTKKVSDKTSRPLVFPEQMRYVCEELDDLKKENLELHSMVRLYTEIIKDMGDKILFLSDEAAHLDRMLEISESHNRRISENR